MYKSKPPRQVSVAEFLTWSNVEMAGDRPPWTLKILFSMRADKLQCNIINSEQPLVEILEHKCILLSYKQSKK